MKTRALPVLLVGLLAAIVLAGCATGGDKNDTTTGQTTPTGQAMTDAQAQALLHDLGANPPQKFGLDATISKGGADLLTLTGAFDNASGEAFMTFHMDPKFLANASGSMGGGGDASSMALLANGITIYVTKSATLYLVNGTAFVFPAAGSGEKSFAPSVGDSPLGQFSKPDALFGALGENVTVKSVKSIVYKTHPALEIQAATKGGAATPAEATIVVLTQPTRLARIEGDLPTNSSGSDPLGGGHMVMELSYDNDVAVHPTPAAIRAAGLLYKNDQTSGGFGGGSSGGPATWTFQNSGGIALGEIEAQVKNVSSGEASGYDSVAKSPTLWSMKLSEGTKTTDGVTITYTDTDHDNKVSKGDTLVIDSGGADTPAQVVLYDTVTGTYVVPAAGLWVVALAALAAAAIVGRRAT